MNGYFIKMRSVERSNYYLRVIIQFVRNSVRKIIDSIFLVRTYFIYLGRFDSISDNSLPDGFTLAVVKTRDEYLALIESGCDFSSYPKSENVEDALSSGAILICIFKERCLAHTMWLAFDYSQAKYDSLFITGCVGQEADSFIGPCNTYPRFRGLGLYPATLALACNLLRNHGVSRAFINTKKSNLPSIRGIEKANFKLVKKARVIHIFRYKFTFITTMNRGTFR